MSDRFIAKADLNPAQLLDSATFRRNPNKDRSFLPAPCRLFESRESLTLRVAEKRERALEEAREKHLLSEQSQTAIVPDPRAAPSSSTPSSAPSDQFARDFVCEMSQQDDAPDATAADTYKEGLEEYHASLRTQTDVEAAIAAIKSKTLNNGVNFLPFNEVFETMTFHSGYPKRIPYADAPEKMKEVMKYGVPQKTQSAGGIPVPMPPMGILRSYSVVTPPAVFNDHLLLHNQEAVEAGHNSTCTELSHKIRLEKTDFDRKLSGVQLKVNGMLIGERYVQPTTMRCPSEKQLTDVTLIFNDVVKILKDPSAGLIDKNKVLESVKLLYLFLNAAVDQVDGQYLSWADWRMKYSLELLFQLNYMSLRRDDEGGISAVSSKNEIFMRLFDSKGSAPGKQLS